MRTRSREQEDYLLRIIKQAAEALRRLREMLNGAASDTVRIRAEATDATNRLLGAEAMLLTHLDATTAVRLVNDARRAELWAELIDLDADACERAGDARAVTVKRERAAAIRAAIRAAQPSC